GRSNHHAPRWKRGLRPPPTRTSRARARVRRRRRPPRELGREMSVWAIARIAFRALLVNKTRSALTALGIGVGVGAVVAMVAIGDGARAEVDRSFGAMGSNVLVVTSGSGRSGGSRTGAGSLPTLTWDDLAAIRSEIPGVFLAAPHLKTTGQVA